MTQVRSTQPDAPAGPRPKSRKARKSTTGITSTMFAVNRERLIVWGLRLSVAAVILIVWQIVGKTGNPVFTSYPTAVAKAGWSELGSHEIWTALLQSLRTLGAGLAFSIPGGIICGLVLGRYKRVSDATEWLVNALNATPMLAVIPLIIVWFGLGLQAKTVIVGALTILPILINTASGVSEVETLFLEVGHAFVGSEWQIFRKIIFPSSIPYIVTGLRISIGHGLVAVVAAEFFTGLDGLGALVQTYGNSFQTDRMLVVILMFMVLGVLLSSILRFIERRAAPWRQGRR